MIYPPPDRAEIRDLFNSPRSGDRAEADVYQALARMAAQDPEWRVLWSVAVPGGAHGREIDFLAAHPTLGVVLFEVKSIPYLPPGSPGSQWTTVTGGATGREAPDRQLAAQASALKSWLRNTMGFRVLPRILQVLVLAGTSTADLKAAGGSVTTGAIIPGYGTVSDIVVDQIKHAYLVPREAVDSLLPLAGYLLTDQATRPGHLGIGGCVRSIVEQDFCSRVIPMLIPQAGCRAPAERIGAMALEPVIQPKPKSKVAFIVAAALVALGAALWWEKKLSAPAMNPPVPAVGKPQPAPKQPAAEKPRPNPTTPPTSPKPVATKPAQAPEGARIADPSGAGRECYRQEFPGIIEGEQVKLTRTLCRDSSGRMVIQ